MGKKTRNESVPEKTVWIQNTHRGDIKVVAREPDPERPGHLKETSHIFQRFKADKMTGQVEHSGYTEVPVALFELFMQYSSLFASLLKKKTFIKFDKPPAGAATPAEQIIRLSGEVQMLREQLAAVSKERDDARSALQAKAEAGAA
jgi:hypothetical protein